MRITDLRLRDRLAEVPYRLRPPAYISNPTWILSESELARVTVQAYAYFLKVSLVHSRKVGYQTRATMSGTLPLTSGWTMIRNIVEEIVGNEF